MRFYLEGIGNPEDSNPFPKRLDNRWDRFTIQELAMHFHQECGGWEFNSWPYTFVILDDDNQEVIRYSVEREAEPVFYASDIPKKA